MKKVFQTKLRSLTKVLTLVIIASLATFTGCTSYDEDITDLQGQIDKVVTDVATLKTSVAALQASVNGMTYIKSITMGTDGKLTITPSTGTAIVYDAKNYVTYDIALVNNVLTVNGVNKGTVAIPALTFGADNKLMSGTTVVADLSSWVRTLTLSSDNYLMINGVKSTILIPAATVQSVDVKGIAINGNVLTITKNDGTTSTITLPQTALTLTAVSSNNGELTLNLNGVDTKVTIKNTYAVVGGFLTVNGVATTVAIPAENKTSVIFSKVDGVIVSATVSDGKDTFTVKLNPTQELLAGLLFVPTIIESGVNTVDYGYMLGLDANNSSVKSLYQYLPLNFRINPADADISKTTWSFVTNSATFRAPSVVPGDIAGVFATPEVENNNGYGVFTLKAVSDPWSGVDAGNAVAGLKRTITLQATCPDFYDNTKTKVVTSDLVKVQPVQFNPWISNAKVAGFVHYYSTSPNLDNTISVPNHEIVFDSQLPAGYLKTLVKASADKAGINEKDFADYNFRSSDYTFKFSLVANYNGLDGQTDQNAFIQIDETKGDLKVLQGTASIERRPLVKVELRSIAGNYLLKTAYIKFKIVRTASPNLSDYPADVVTGGPFDYASLFKGNAVIANNLTPVTLGWVAMNKIYTDLKLSHNEYVDTYKNIIPTVSGTHAGTAYTGAELTSIFNLVRSPNEREVDSYAYQLQLNPLVKFGENIITYVFTPSDLTKAAKVTLTFKFTVNAPALNKAIVSGYQYGGSTTTVMTQGQNDTGGAYKMQLYLGEGFAYAPAMKAMFATATAGRIDGATHQFIVTDNVKYGTAPTFTLTPNGATSNLDVLLGTGTNTGTLMGLNNTITDDRTYPVNFKTTYPNSEVDNFNYTVLFKNPLTIDLISGSTFTLTDKVDGTPDTKDIAGNYEVKFLGQSIVKGGVTQTIGTTLGYTNIGLGYSISGGTTYQTLSLVAPSTLKWSNAGTKLTNTQSVGSAVCIYSTPIIAPSTFSAASVSRTDVVSVQPGN